MFLDKSKILKIGIGLALLSVPIIFVTSTVNGESGVCKNANYGEYEEGDGMVFCKPNEDSVYDNISIVYGNTAGSPAPQIDKKKDGKKEYSSYNVLKNGIASRIAEKKGPSYINLISAASNKKSTDYDIEIEKKTDINEAQKFIDWVDTSIAGINEEIKQAPSADGAQYLEAINKAGRSGSTDEKSIIYVYGSGLSDGGLLDFSSNNYFNQEADILAAEFIEQNPKLEDILKGKTIVWYGIGQTIAPQYDLCENELESLKGIYEEILKAEGAKKVYFENEPRDANLVENNTYGVKKAKTACAKLPEKLYIKFIPNTATYLNEAEAYEAIMKKASDKINNQEKIKLVGYMAPEKCGSSQTNSLPLERANAVKNSLVQMGIDESRITTQNGGIYESEKSVCPNGQWDENIATEKRLVEIW